MSGPAGRDPRTDQARAAAGGRARPDVTAPAPGDVTAPAPGDRSGPPPLARRAALLGLVGGLAAGLAACMPDGTGARPSRLPDEGPLWPLPGGDPAAPAGRGRFRLVRGPGTVVMVRPDGNVAEVAVTPPGRRRSG